MATQPYDVLIIGSGASGGMTAHTLTATGPGSPPVSWPR